jgi:hypothetical protein
MSNPAIKDLSTWLAHTKLSSMIQGAAWVIPAIQTVHILAVAVAIASFFMLDLRLIGVFAKNEPANAIANRLLPWGWGALAVLATSGILLIVAEPERCLANSAFWAKMLILALALLTTCVLRSGLQRNSGCWEGSLGRKLLSKIIAATSLLLWSGVVLAGRWIAYLGAA